MSCYNQTKFQGTLLHGSEEMALKPFSFCSKLLPSLPPFFSGQAFMFESSFSMAVTRWGEETCHKLDADYYQCWQGIRKNFDPSWKPDKEERYVQCNI